MYAAVITARTFSILSEAEWKRIFRENPPWNSAQWDRFAMRIAINRILEENDINGLQ